MDENAQAHRLKVQVGWIIYMGIIVIIYLWFAAIVAINDRVIDLVLMFLTGLSGIATYIYGTYIVWINYIFVAVAVSYSVYCLCKDRKPVIFFSVLIVAALNIVGSIGVQQFAMWVG